MRKWLTLGVVPLLLALFALPARAVPAAEHFWQSGETAAVAFADPADCADGECTGVFVTFGSGSFQRQPIAGIAIFYVQDAVVVDGNLIGVADPSLAGCTTDVNVALDGRLRFAVADTGGSAELSLWEGDPLACVTPIGHWADLDARLIGVGPTWASANQHRYADAWTRDVGGYSDATRGATGDATLTIDGVTYESWPGTAVLDRWVLRETVVNHSRPVGPPAGQTIKVPAGSMVVAEASGSTDQWQVYAQDNKMSDGSAGVYLTMFGEIGGEWVWGDAVTPTVTIASNLSGAAASGTVELYRDTPDGPEWVGTVEVSAAWVGVGDPWWWTNKTAARGTDGSGSSVMRGSNREASFTLTVDEVESADAIGQLSRWTMKTSGA